MTTPKAPAAHPLGEAAGSAKFVLQRPEYPDWYAGKNMQGYACWTSQYGDAKFVRLDELVETMQWLAKEKPSATLHSPNNRISRSGDR